MSESLLFYSMILLAEFLVLAVLAMFLQRLLGWEMAFERNRETWMSRLRMGRRKMRATRRQLAGLDEKLAPEKLLPKNDIIRGLLAGRAAYKFFAGRKTARS